MFKRRESDGPTMVSQVVLAIKPAQLPWLAGRVYHVRRFHTPTLYETVFVLGDLGNPPEVSVTNRFEEVAAIVTELEFGIRAIDPVDLRDVARWVTFYPEGAHGPFGESFVEAWFEPGSDPAYPAYRHRNLRREEVETLVGGRVGFWRAKNYTARTLRRRGVRVLDVHR